MTYIYLAPTKERWIEIVRKAQAKGKDWRSGRNETNIDYWEDCQEESVLFIGDDYITFADREHAKKMKKERGYILTWLIPSLMHPTLIGKDKPQTP